MNTSDNQLINVLLSKANADIKESFETLLQGDTIREIVDENVVFCDLK